MSNEFMNFKMAVRQQFDNLSDFDLFRTDVSKDDVIFADRSVKPVMKDGSAGVFE